MMRVGTQRSKKTSSTSPILSSSYRQSPTSGLNQSSRLNASSPVSNLHTTNHSFSNSHFNSSKTHSNMSTSQSYRQTSASPVYNDTSSKLLGSNMSTSQSYRQTASPVYGDSSSKLLGSNITQSSNYRQESSPVYDNNSKYTSSTDYHKMSSAERIISGSPNFERNRQSPSYMDRQRISPNLGSSEHITSKKLSERKLYESSSPILSKQIHTEQHDYNKYNQESSFTNKVSSMRISESRSPVFMVDRSSPSLNYRYEKQENKSYNSSFDDNIDTSPLMKVSASTDRATARRDSWDAINKTRGILSHRSLESVANLGETQLESELSRRNESSYKSEEHFTTSRENSYQQGEKFQSQLQSSKVAVKRGGGAASVKVQPVPDGVLGQPVEFESKNLLPYALSVLLPKDIWRPWVL